MKATTAAVLDTRYDKTGPTKGSFPVRIRITYRDNDRSIQRYFPTKFNFTEKDWKSMKGSRPGDLKEKLHEINALESKAAAIVEKMGSFSPQVFKKKFDRNKSNTGLLSASFDDYIKTLEDNDQVGTAISYGCSKKSIEAFKPGATFADITPETLKQYEKWMQKKGNSITTVGMYLRCVRSLFNVAIAAGDIPADIYPFGKTAHRIKKGARRKIALTLPEIASIFNYKAKGQTAKAKDLFLFMYLANGINPKDLLLLKYKDIEGNFIKYYRQKTAKTKSDQQEIKIHIKPEMKAIIERWGNKKDKDSYIFPVLVPGLSAKQIHYRKSDFVKFMNTELKQIAIDCKIDKPVTTYVSRHSYASVLKRSGASTELISETLGHSDLKTTQNYLAGFEDATLINATNALTDFKNKKTAKIVNI